MNSLRYLLDTQEEMLSRQLRCVSLELRETWVGGTLLGVL